MPTTVDFLSRVLPDTGAYFYATEKPTYTDQKSYFSQTGVSDIKSLLAGTNNQDKNTYFATASYTGTESREAPFVKLKKSFYVDVDVGPDKTYKDLKEAITALKKFLHATGLPMPTAIIESGGGLHLYWILERSISADLWLRLAECLKAACIKESFAADHVCTTDITRVMRVPGTNNVKVKDQPRACKIMHMADDDTTTEILSGAISKYAVITGSVADDLFEDAEANKQPLPDMDAGDIPFMNAKDLVSAAEYSKSFAKHMFGECGAMADILMTGGAGLSEPGWMHSLNLLAYCEDGHQFIHSISDKHNTYSKERTEEKFQKRMLLKGTKKSGPTLCKTFEMSCPAACTACPHNGRIKTPLVLGYEPKDGSIIPWPFEERTDGIWRLPTENSNDDEPVQITNFTIHDMALTEDHEGLTVSFTGATGAGKREFNGLYGEVSEERGVVSLLAKQKLILDNYQRKGFIQLMQAWSKKLQQAGQVKNGHSQFGWVKSGTHHGFVTGNATHWEHQPPTPSLMRDQTLRQQYTATGDLEEWKKAAALVSQNDDESLLLVLASGFASPLMKFTTQPGGILSASSSKSGTGKTSVSKISQAIWGDPINGLNGLDDTDNSVLKRAGLIGALPMYMDELRGPKMPAFVTNVIFRIAGGKEKSRLKSTTAFQTTGTWSTLMTVTSNERLLDHIEQHIHSSDAGHRRVLEFDVPVNTPYKPGDRYVIDAVNDNYGVAGEIYAAHLVKNRAKIAQVVKKYDLQFSSAAGLGTDARFWTSIAAALLVGTMLAKECGLVDFDIKRVYEALLHKLKISNIQAVKVAQSGSGVSLREVLGNYMEERIAHTISSDRLPTTAYTPEYTYKGGSLKMVKTPISALVSEDGGMIIPIKQLQEFVRENGYMWGALRDAIMEVPSSTVNAMYDVSGMVGPESFPVPCVKIDMVAVRQLQ